MRVKDLGTAFLEQEPQSGRPLPAAYLQPLRAPSLRKRTPRRTNNSLCVAAFGEPARQSQQSLLPAAPFVFGIDVNDGKLAHTLVLKSPGGAGFSLQRALQRPNRTEAEASVAWLKPAP